MQHRRNNFDALRLVGALLVALGHTMDVVLGYDGLGALTNNQSFGGLGLNIFCTISGYLITRSRQRNAPGSFFRSRALRIFPALIVAVPLMALVLGPLVTTLPVATYFATGGTWRFLASILIFPLNPGLPGVFGGVGIIGQLYSLTAEVAFYIFVGTLGGWRHFPKIVAALLIVTWAVFLHTDYGTLPFSNVFSLSVAGTTAFFYPVRLGTLCVFYLLVGSAVAILAPDPAKLSRIAMALLPVWILALFAHDRRVYDMVEMAMLPIVVLGLGMMSRFAITLPEKLGDISYGTYVYHFAIAELVFTLFPDHSRGWSMVALAVVLSAVVGWLSFQCVEKRALSKKAAPTQEAVADVSVAARSAIHVHHEQAP